MGGSVWNRYMSLVTQVQSCSNVTKAMKESLTLLVRQADEQDRFSQPMLWIGIYIALASLLCVLLMLADSILGVVHNKPWFPSKYFPLNAVSLSLIAIATKLPMDLNNPMPGFDDQDTKLGSMAFMCTMMANLLPSLATMDSKELVTNVTALGVLVITLVVNVCIQISTGVISYVKPEGASPLPSAHLLYILVAIFYVGMLLMLLMIYICSSLAILKSKHILESKYQACHQASLQLQQSGGLITIEKLKQHVRNYWIMTTTGNPQFMASNSITTTASGVICAISTIIYLVTVTQTDKSASKTEYKSDYASSMRIIFLIQFMGTSVCSIVPIYRSCHVSFDWSMEGILKYSKVFKVESYWTDKLYEWKKTGIPFPFRNLRCKIVIEKLKFLFLGFCIGFQKAVVVVCKIVGLLPVFIITCILLISILIKKGLNALGIVSGSREQDTDLSQYDASLQDHMEIGDHTLMGLSDYLKWMMQVARRPKNLMVLLEKYGGFEKVGNANIHHFPSLLGEEIMDSWSLKLVTLTAIAISLPNVQQNIVDSLVSSVNESLKYVTLVEESLNASNCDHVKAAKRLWLEVEVQKKWLGNKLKNLTPQGNTTRSILQWFMDRAQSMVNANDVESMEIDFNCRSISAHSMYSITETILISNIDNVSPEELFTRISSTISDIFVACLINLPQVIQIKCQESAPEKREASVHSAAELLGETMQIIQRLQDRELPPSDLDGLSFFSRWRAYLWSSSMRIWAMLFSWGT